MFINFITILILTLQCILYKTTVESHCYTLISKIGPVVTVNEFSPKHFDSLNLLYTDFKV